MTSSKMDLSTIIIKNGDHTIQGGIEKLNFVCTDFIKPIKSTEDIENKIEEAPLSDEDAIHEVDSSGPTEEDLSVRPWTQFWKYITVEPLLFLHMFALCISSVVMHDLFIDRICRISYDQSDEICGNLTAYPELSKIYDGEASSYVFYRGLIEGCLPIAISLFLGPWTDIYGAKWPMVFSMIFFSMNTILYLLLVHIPLASPQVLLTASIPVFIGGGLITVAISSIYYVTKITTQENRTFRIAVVETVWLLGVPGGTLAGKYLYEYGGYSAVFGTSSGVYFIGFLYGLIFIPEETVVVECRNCFMDMLNIQAVTDMCKAVIRGRNGRQRCWLYLMIVTAGLTIFTIQGFAQTVYLYTRAQFDWEYTDFSTYFIAESLIGLFGSIVTITVCMHYLKLPDAIIGIGAICGTTAAQFTYAFASSTWMLYVGATLKMFIGLIIITLRAMISKTVGKEEVAKVFTIMLCVEQLMSLGGVASYGGIFSYTATTFPGAIFAFGGMIYLVILSNFIFLYFSMRSTSGYIEIESTSSELSD